MTKLFDEWPLCCWPSTTPNALSNARAARGAGKTRRGLQFLAKAVAREALAENYVGFGCGDPPEQGREPEDEPGF